jgi:hypothetical protein
MYKIDGRLQVVINIFLAAAKIAIVSPFCKMGGVIGVWLDC